MLTNNYHSRKSTKRDYLPLLLLSTCLLTGQLLQASHHAERDEIDGIAIIATAAEFACDFPGCGKCYSGTTGQKMLNHHRRKLAHYDPVKYPVACVVPGCNSRFPTTDTTAEKQHREKSHPELTCRMFACRALGCEKLLKTSEWRNMHEVRQHELYLDLRGRPYIPRSRGAKRKPAEISSAE